MAASADASVARACGQAAVRSLRPAGTQPHVVGDHRRSRASASHAPDAEPSATTSVKWPGRAAGQRRTGHSFESPQREDCAGCRHRIGCTRVPRHRSVHFLHAARRRRRRRHVQRAWRRRAPHPRPGWSRTPKRRRRDAHRHASSAPETITRPRPMARDTMTGCPSTRPEHGDSRTRRRTMRTRSRSARPIRLGASASTARRRPRGNSRRTGPVGRRSSGSTSEPPRTRTKRSSCSTSFDESARVP